MKKYKFLETLNLDIHAKNVWFLPYEDICNAFQNLPELENSLQEKNKMVLIYIAGYICREDEKTDETLFLL